MLKGSCRVIVVGISESDNYKTLESSSHPVQGAFNPPVALCRMANQLSWVNDVYPSRGIFSSLFSVTGECHMGILEKKIRSDKIPVNHDY